MAENEPQPGQGERCKDCLNQLQGISCYVEIIKSVKPENLLEPAQKNGNQVSCVKFEPDITLQLMNQARRWVSRFR